MTILNVLCCEYSLKTIPLLVMLSVLCSVMCSTLELASKQLMCELYLIFLYNYLHVASQWFVLLGQTLFSVGGYCLQCKCPRYAENNKTLLGRGSDYAGLTSYGTAQGQHCEHL